MDAELLQNCINRAAYSDSDMLSVSSAGDIMSDDEPPREDVDIQREIAPGVSISSIIISPEHEYASIGDIVYIEYAPANSNEWISTAMTLGYNTTLPYCIEQALLRIKVGEHVKVYCQPGYDSNLGELYKMDERKKKKPFGSIAKQIESIRRKERKALHQAKLSMPSSETDHIYAFDLKLISLERVWNITGSNALRHVLVPGSSKDSPPSKSIVHYYKWVREIVDDPSWPINSDMGKDIVESLPCNDITKSKLPHVTIHSEIFSPDHIKNSIIYSSLLNMKRGEMNRIVIPGESTEEYLLYLIDWVELHYDTIDLSNDLVKKECYERTICKAHLENKTNNPAVRLIPIDNGSLVVLSLKAYKKIGAYNQYDMLQVIKHLTASSTPKGLENIHAVVSSVPQLSSSPKFTLEEIKVFKESNVNDICYIVGSYALPTCLDHILKRMKVGERSVFEASFTNSDLQIPAIPEDSVEHETYIKTIVEQIPENLKRWSDAVTSSLTTLQETTMDSPETLPLNKLHYQSPKEETSTMYFDITIKGIVWQTNDIFSLEDKEKLSLAAFKKQVGNIFFNNKKYLEALDCYNQGIDALRFTGCYNTLVEAGRDTLHKRRQAVQNSLAVIDISNHQFKISREEHEIDHELDLKIKSLISTLYYNKSVTCSKLGLMTQSTTAADYSLICNPDNLRAYVRLIEHYIQSDHMDMAYKYNQEGLYTTSGHEEESKVFLNYKNLLEKKQKEVEKAFSTMYRGIFRS